MSKGKLSGITIVEKILGIVVLIIGGIMTYSTLTNIKAAGMIAYVFFAVGIALTVLGLILIVERSQ